jgi:hypothetical protein
MLRTNPSWRPSSRADAKPRRIFTDAQEDALVERTRTSRLAQGHYRCNEGFRHTALRFDEKIHEQLDYEALMKPEAQHRLESLRLFKMTALSSEALPAQSLFIAAPINEEAMRSNTRSTRRFWTACPRTHPTIFP